MDYRNRFIQDLETALTGIFDPGQVAVISRTAVKLLGHSGVNTTMKYININNSKVMASYQQYIA